MFIKELKINGFGVIKDFELELSNGLNLISGPNESGKSTITDFIKSMFYGISKNKDGKTMSDYERFKPWNSSASFSGKIVYEHKGVEYSLFRDFNNNSAKLYDEMGLEVSTRYNIDKARGLEVGREQLGIDVETFCNSLLVKQKEIELSDNKQKLLIQKLTNTIQTGEEDFSYTENMKRLQKKLYEEVGTDRTSNKPKNIIGKEIEDLETQIKSLIEQKENLELIKIKTAKLDEEIAELENNSKEVEKVYKVKMEFNDETKEEQAIYDAKLEVQKEQHEKVKKTVKKKKIADTFIILLAILVLVGALLYYKEYAYSVATLVIGIVITIVNYKLSYKEELAVEVTSFDLIVEEINKKQAKKLKELESLGIKRTIIERTIPDLRRTIEKLENDRKADILEKQKLQIENDIISKQVTNIIELEEKLEDKKEEYNKLLEKEEALKLAINTLTDAYDELKVKIIPEIEQDLKYSISKMTNGQYKSVKYSDENGLIVENEYGEVIDIEQLSTGTIEQLYLGFRLTLADKYEKIALVFDESFAYSDDERLKNILTTLAQIAESRQVIIFSCSNREEEVLRALNVKHNLIYFCTKNLE